MIIPYLLLESLALRLVVKEENDLYIYMHVEM